jgi:hypothetical protein
MLKPGGITMKLPRRQFLHLAASAAALRVLTRPATALDYPPRKSSRETRDER